MISYNPLWKTLIDKDMKKMDLIILTGINNSPLAKLNSNKSASLGIIKNFHNYMIDSSIFTIITNTFTTINTSQLKNFII